MSDNYRKGAEQAGKDFPHNRLASRAFVEFAKNGLGLVPGAQGREDEFRAGYKDTHRAKSSDSQRVIQTQTASQTASVTGSSSSASVSPSANVGNSQTGGGGTMSYAVQVALLEQLKAYLERFDTGLSNVDLKYKSQMDALSGLMMREDWNLLFSEHYEPTSAGIQRVRDFLMEASVPVLNVQISYFGDKSASGATGQLGGVMESDLAHGTSPGNHRTWQGQIELLEEFKAFLGRLEVSLSLFHVNYRQKVEGLEDVMKDAHAEFVEHQLEPTLALIEKMREFIANESVPTVARIIANIEGRPSL